MSTTIEGIYLNGRIELSETPNDVCEGTRVIVTFLSPGSIDLRERGIDETQAADLRARFSTFVEDWESPEMSVYDNMDKRTELNEELRPEYDQTVLKNGIRGKYAERYAAGTNIIKLDPDVAAAFPNEKAVNEALRFVLKVMDDTKQLIIQQEQ